MSTGGTTTQASQSTSVNQIPQWMSNAGQQNYAFAQQVAEQPLQQYQGQTVPDVAPQTQQLWDVAANSGNVGADQYGAGTAGYLNALGQNPMSVSSPGNANAVTAGQIGDLAKPIVGGGGASGGWGDSPGNPLAGTGYANYMNPYTQSVINATLPGMQQANALSQNQQANAANSSNAFGGSRQGIQQGVAQAQGAQNIGQMLAGLNSANFMQAQAAATGDINRAFDASKTNQGSQQTDFARAMQAQLANQTAGQNKINSDILASQGLTNTGDSMNKANVANAGLLQSAGAGQSMQAQNQINSQIAKFNQAFNYPQQQLGTLLSALGMTPHDTSTAGQQTQQTTTPTDWANLIGGGLKDAASIYSMLPSDERLKKDITPAGTGPAGIPIYKFRYKGALAGSPKAQGPMAQDVQKVVPQAVSPIPGSGGKLQIHLPTLSAATEDRPSIPQAATPKALSTFMPPVAAGRGATTALRAGARGVKGALSNTKLKLRVMGGLSG